MIALADIETAIAEAETIDELEALEEILREHSAQGKESQAASRGQRERDRRVRANRTAYQNESDIGPIDYSRVNWVRRIACKTDLTLFSQAYFPESTGLAPFGKSQLSSMSRTEKAILRNGRILNAEPRGFAKSSRSEAAILWAMLYGHRRFILFYGSTEDEAESAMESIQSELAENADLIDDFPEVCQPIAALEGKHMRCLSQHSEGELTKMKWNTKTLVLPTVKDSASSGIVFRTKGINTASRGARKKSKGRQNRPDLIIIDDPQTDDIAGNDLQVQKLKRRIYKSLLRLGGHGRKVTVIMNATIIAKNDLIDQLCDHKLHSDWQAVRSKMMIEMPENLESFWLGEYAKIRRDYDEHDENDQDRAHRDATAHYQQNRNRADKGAVVGWPHIPLEVGEVSAIQHAMNIYIDDGRAVFLSECQNDPEEETEALGLELNLEHLQKRMGVTPAGMLPPGVEYITCGIDIQHNVMFYVVVGWTSTGGSFVIEFGTYPQQKRTRFGKADIKTTNLYSNPQPKTLQEAAGTDDLQAAVAAGLNGNAPGPGRLGQPGIIEILLGHEYESVDGSPRQIDRLAIDCNDANLKQTILRACYESPHRARIHPCVGKGVTVNSPWSRLKSETKDTRVKHGTHCKLKPPEERGLRQLIIDTNHWKTHVAHRLTCHPESQTAMLFFRTEPHKLYRLAQACCEETPTWVSNPSTGATAIEWKGKRKGRLENDEWDCLIYASACANIDGVKTHYEPKKKAKARKVSGKLAAARAKRQGKRQR